MIRLIALGFLAFLLPTASALTTAYVSFEHPDGWRCELSQGVWICQSTIEPDRKESVVLSIATMATEWDTLDNYENYLKQPRPIQDEEGNTLMSKVTYARRRNINGTTWVDSLQQNSELPGFWARYVATVHNKLAILITYIVSEEQYAKLAPQFERMVSSLKPNSEFDLNIASKQGDGLPPNQKLGQVQKEIIRDRLTPKGKGGPAVAANKPAEAQTASNNLQLMVVAGAAILIAFILIRARRRKKAKAQAGPRGRGGPPAPTGGGPGRTEPTVRKQA